jgi:hypothetical protein
MPWVANILEKVDLLAVGVSDIFQPEQSIHTLVSSGPISTQVERHFLGGRTHNGATLVFPFECGNI